ncbi:MAG: hypothetical protein JSW08_00745 [archaeon]|nr:MAG: hypothetical protein JSW08_00745 [archaeon]
MRKKCPNKKDNEQDCPCPFTECRRHGICCECLQYHRALGSRTACITGFRKGFSEGELEEIQEAEENDEED